MAFFQRGGSGALWGFFRTRPFLTLGLLGGICFMAWGLWTYFTPAPPPPPKATAEHKAKMERLSLTEIKEGGKHWVLDAKKAEYLKDRDEIRIQGIYLEFYGLGQEVIYLRAREGLVHTKNRDLTIRGGVELARGDLTIRTEEVRYLPEKRAIVAPEEVVLEGPRTRVSGKDLVIDLIKRRLVLKHHQKTEVKLQKGLL